jgi:hypothetical protein
MEGEVDPEVIDKDHPNLQVRSTSSYSPVKDEETGK